MSRQSVAAAAVVLVVRVTALVPPIDRAPPKLPGDYLADHKNPREYQTNNKLHHHNFRYKFIIIFTTVYIYIYIYKYLLFI